MTVYTYSYSASVLYLTSDWIVVLWIWLEDWVCVCAAASRATTEATAGSNPTKAGAKVDFCEPVFSRAHYEYVIGICIQFNILCVPANINVSIDMY